MPDSSKQAEKEYLARAGTARWERVKPFSSPGYDDVAEGARLIHDFAVMLACLAPRPGQRILDLGAGSCWASEWLTRYGIEAISADIATDMLRIGRDRIGPGARLVAADAEALPLAAESVDHVIVLNAFHHWPDGARALAEIHRVLRPGGRLFLGEPGRGHADASSSVEATGAYGVQEEDVIASTLVADCRQAGFARVVLKPIAYTVPWFEIDADRWDRWQRFARRRRPLRALDRIGRALADALGLGKADAGFEDTLGMELVRILEGAVGHHPIVLADKGAAPRR